MGVAPFDLYTAPARRPSRTVSRPTAKSRRKAWVSVAEAACVFALAIVSTYGLSVLTGKSLSENARLDNGRNQVRARAARLELSGLEQRLDLRANPRRVGEWAKNNDFERDANREVPE